MQLPSTGLTYYPRFNSDGTTVSQLTAANLRADLGSTVGGNILSLTNPSAISYLRINADNSVTALTPSNFKQGLQIYEDGIMYSGI